MVMLYTIRKIISCSFRIKIATVDENAYFRSYKRFRKVYRNRILAFYKGDMLKSIKTNIFNLKINDVCFNILAWFFFKWIIYSSGLIQNQIFTIWVFGPLRHTKNTFFLQTRKCRFHEYAVNYKGKRMFFVSLPEGLLEARFLAGLSKWTNASGGFAIFMICYYKKSFTLAPVHKKRLRNFSLGGPRGEPRESKN